MKTMTPEVMKTSEVCFLLCPILAFLFPNPLQHWRSMRFRLLD
jgi:hypothetical protein